MDLAHALSQRKANRQRKITMPSIQQKKRSRRRTITGKSTRSKTSNRILLRRKRARLTKRSKSLALQKSNERSGRLHGHRIGSQPQNLFHDRFEVRQDEIVMTFADPWGLQQNRSAAGVMRGLRILPFVTHHKTAIQVQVIFKRRFAN